MSFRRSDFDVTNRINTTDPVCVKLEIARIFRTTYARTHAPALMQAFDDMVRLYRGDFPGYSDNPEEILAEERAAAEKLAAEWDRAARASLS